MSDVFELQDRITENVVGAIEPKIQLAEIERLKQKPAANLDAYDLLLRAQQLEYEFTEESVLSALRCAQEALVIDPFYAPAMAMESDAFKAGREKLKKIRRRVCGLRNKRCNLPAMMPTSYGWSR